jgi:hypothetical protein
MSATVVHIISYFLKRTVGSSITKISIFKLLNSIQVVDGNHSTTVLAIQSDNPDIEDALQYEIAIKNKMDYFLSSDKKFQKYSTNKLPIVNTSEAFALFFN